MIEIWKDITGYEGLYQVSSFGRIKSLSKIINRRNGTIDTKKERILMPINNGSGYFGVNLCNNTLIYKRQYIHRIVATAFIPNKNNYKEINHKDGNKANNKVSNLEWSTRSLNNYHAYNIGLKIPYNRSGRLNPNYKHGKYVKIND